MRHLCLTLCSIILSCHLMAEGRPNENLSSESENISAARQSYEAAKALLEKTDPEAVIQFDPATGAITVIPSKNSWQSASLSTLLRGTLVLNPINPVQSVVLSGQANQTPGGDVFFGSTTVTSFVSCSGTLTAFQANPKYAQNLPICHFILTEQQMSQFFSHFPPRPEPLNFYGLSESNLYLVIQIKNTGSRHASGTLFFPFFSRFFFISVDVEANTNEFSTYVVPLGNRDSKDFEDTEDVIVV